MNDLLPKLRAAFERLTPGQKARLLVAVLAVGGLVWGLTSYAGRVRYGVLFSNLRGDDAAPIVAALKEKKVPYRLTEGGGAVEVPIERVDELRIELAGEGLPRGGGVGFELFDKPSFGLSDFVQNVNFRRALERELARTIQSIDAIESARVHLALPPASVFADEHREPSASVVVKLRGNRALAANSVGAIQHLVASGVERLLPGNVSVIDGQGRLLSTDSAEGDALSASKIEARRALESGIEQNLVSILEPVVGRGRVRARASVELDLSRVQRVEESYDPDVAVVRSEQKSKSKSGGGSGGGVPGTASNLPGGNAQAAAGSSSSSETQSSTTNFEINKTVATIAEPVGRLTRQSVAVVIDHAPAPAATGEGTEAPKPQPRSEDEMKKITEIVRAAVGVNEERGDVLIVENIPFDNQPDAADLEAERADRWAFWLTIARFAALPIAVLLVLLFLVRPALGILRSMRAPQAPGLPPTIAELQASLGAGALPPGDAVGALRRKLIEAASENPEAAALVVRGWVQGGKRG